MTIKSQGISLEDAGVTASCDKLWTLIREINNQSQLSRLTCMTSLIMMVTSISGELCQEDRVPQPCGQHDLDWGLRPGRTPGGGRHCTEATIHHHWGHHHNTPRGLRHWALVTVCLIHIISCHIHIHMHIQFITYNVESTAAAATTVPGELMGTSWLVPSAFIGPKWAQPRDGAAEKVFWLVLQRLWVKKHVFCHCDWVMHRIHQNERRSRTNKFFL